MYEGPGAFHEQVAPSHVAPLRLDGVAACLLFDRAASDAASRRLAKESNAKGASRVALETSHAAAALLSLAGVRTVLTNQWAVAAQSNHEMLVAVLAKLGGGATLGDALGACAWLRWSSRRRRRPMRGDTPAEGGAEAPAPAEVSDALAAAEDAPAAAEDAPAEAPAPAVAAEPEVGMPLWTVLANPVIYGLPNFTVS